ncbi:Hypothetical protein A7982_02435 [Minicystis rosea]|nr:Hypothetical protein A7982_02435 [Minicystis rosea]
MISPAPHDARDPEAEALRRSRRAAVIAARTAFASVAVGIAAATILRSTGPALLHAMVDLPFALLCHRIPERVISILGVPMPLCSRCLGIWMGLSISAALAWPALPLRALRIVVPAAALFMLAEVVTQDLGLHPVFHPTRILSGLLLSVPIGGAIGALMTREALGNGERS